MAEREKDHGSSDEIAFQPAQFPINLHLPPADNALVTEAAIAVRQEFRDCSKWKKLICKRVSIFAERERGTVCVIHVGTNVEFDWTWEGAVAFRPSSLDEDPEFANYPHEEAAFDDAALWSGEVLEVDERSGCLFISLNNPESIPTAGPFFVRPFEFLSVIDSVFNGDAFKELRADLPARLLAAAGSVHPAIDSPAAGLPNLLRWWQHSWCVLWGPPGAGKTWLTGQQIANVLADPTERILVVSTTNRATDAVALAIGKAAQSCDLEELESAQLLRIGKGASVRQFTAAKLDSMLSGTESESLHELNALAEQLQRIDSWEEKALTRKQITTLRARISDQSKTNFVNPAVRVVVSTAFKALCQLNSQQLIKQLENGQSPFTTIFIDEAGLLPRTAVAALSLFASKRVVLAGDSKQLAPISRIARILPSRQQNWLASSGLSHLDDLLDTPAAVHVLSEQRRMHPDVCQLVSDYQYQGLLKSHPETSQRPSVLPTSLANFSRTIWYVLDQEGLDLATIRSERGPGNKSWIRPITSCVLEKLFADVEIRQAHGLFISPYLAQAQEIAKLLAAWNITTWESSTVHSQQGSEADIVVFDTVNASSTNWPYDEWKRRSGVAELDAR